MVSEAIACGTPILASDIPGNRGLLGNYEGYFPVGDTETLRERLEQFERQPVYRRALVEHVESLQGLVEPDREQETWRELLEELTNPDQYTIE